DVARAPEDAAGLLPDPDRPDPRHLQRHRHGGGRRAVDRLRRPPPVLAGTARRARRPLLRELLQELLDARVVRDLPGPPGPRPPPPRARGHAALPPVRTPVIDRGR